MKTKNILASRSTWSTGILAVLLGVAMVTGGETEGVKEQAEALTSGMMQVVAGVGAIVAVVLQIKSARKPSGKKVVLGRGSD